MEVIPVPGRSLEAREIVVTRRDDSTGRATKHSGVSVVINE